MKTITLSAEARARLARQLAETTGTTVRVGDAVASSKEAR